MEQIINLMFCDLIEIQNWLDELFIHGPVRLELLRSEKE